MGENVFKKEEAKMTYEIEREKKDPCILTFSEVKGKPGRPG